MISYHLFGVIFLFYLGENFSAVHESLKQGLSIVFKSFELDKF